MNEQKMREAGLRDEIARLNHQHKNDEAANRMLSDACARQADALARKEALLDHATRFIAVTREYTIRECAALFSGSPRNREIYVNDVEEVILGLLNKAAERFDTY